VRRGYIFELVLRPFNDEMVNIAVEMVQQKGARSTLKADPQLFWSLDQSLEEAYDGPKDSAH